MQKNGNIYHQYIPNVSIYTSTMDPSWVIWYLGVGSTWYLKMEERLDVLPILLPFHGRTFLVIYHLFLGFQPSAGAAPEATRRCTLPRRAARSMRCRSCWRQEPRSMWPTVTAPWDAKLRYLMGMQFMVKWWINDGEFMVKCWSNDGYMMVKWWLTD